MNRSLSLSLSLSLSPPHFLWGGGVSLVRFTIPRARVHKEIGICLASKTGRSGGPPWRGEGVG